MHRYLFLLILLSTITGCKKIKENVEEKKVLDFITEGQWQITNLTKGSTNYQSDFGGYIFQFKSNSTVDAIKNGTLQKTGNWQGNATNYTITSAFPADTIHPLLLLNGTWQIVDGGSNFVVATKTDNGELSTLRMDKV